MKTTATFTQKKQATERLHAAHIHYADERACYWLAEANKEIEAGRAESNRRMVCERKAQYWLDRLNALEGHNS